MRQSQKNLFLEEKFLEAVRQGNLEILKSDTKKLTQIRLH